MSEVDYLTEDTNLPNGQNYVCLSFYIDKLVVKAVKIRGTYGSYEDACNQANKLRKTDEYFDVFVGESGKWLPVDPTKKLTDMNKVNEMLNLNMKHYMQSHEKNKSLHEYRKNKLVINNLDENLKIRKQNIEELKSRLSTITDEKLQSSELDNLLQSLKSAEEQVNKMEVKKTELLKENEDYSNRLGNNLNDIDNFETKTEEKSEKSVKYDDDVLPSNQKFVCLSFLSNKYYKLPHNLLGVKVRGVFATEDEANVMAKKLQSIDEYFHIFVGECGNWLAFDPDADTSANSSEYSNEQLNKMMKGYKENQEKAKIFQEQRKSEEMRATLLDDLNKSQTKLSKMRRTSSSEESINNVEKQIALMELKKKELDEKVKNLSDKVDSFSKPEMVLPKVLETDE
jgi:DNA repair exonuclease SbcCD ATPase subunit